MTPPRPVLSCSLAALLALPMAGLAQFRDDFDDGDVEGWDFYTGDGTATVDFVPHEGFARIAVDGSPDAHNVWWAIIKRDVASFLDLEQLQDPAYELRVEARVRPSHAPRRVNIMLNTQRTTNYHEHLREYELPAAAAWRTISFTTQDFDGVPGDHINVQLGVTDWGTGRYHVDIDYYRADIVRRDTAGPDAGEPLIYHPPVRDPATYAHHLPVDHDALVNTNYPDVTFNDWTMTGPDGRSRVLTIHTDQWAVLRWDFGALRGRTAAGAGLLELTTYAVAQGGDYIAAFGEDLGVEFGPLRVYEILGGDPAWDEATVTHRRLVRDEDPAEVFNSQMTIDLPLNEARDGRTFFTLPRPVMQRLLDGTTKGLVLRPLGAVVPSVYAREAADGRHAARLHFDTRD